MTTNRYVPEVCVWELTLQCNMHCMHCGSLAGKKRENELTLTECLKAADELVELGCQRVTLIGGEVFLYPGWEEIAGKLTDRGVLVNIITNGYKLTDHEIKKIHYAGLKNIRISVDGMETNHNRIRNKKNSFAKVLEAFKALAFEKIPVAAVTTLFNCNFPDLENMYMLFLENNVKVWQLQLANPMGSMQQYKEYLLDKEKIPLLTRFIKDKRAENKIAVYAGDDIGYYDANEYYIRSEPGTLCSWSGCQAGLKVIGIDSVGNVKGCESLYSDIFIEGNLRTQALEAIWNDENNFTYNRKFDVHSLAGKCKNCDKGALCKGGCRGSSYFTNDNLFENPYCSYRLAE